MYKYGFFQSDEVVFEWDEGKEKINFEKHGINFSTAMESFEDPHGIAFSDEKHSSESEQRFYWVGKPKGKDFVVTTWYTTRNVSVRIIGCAQLRKFRRLYENTKIK
jgi:uncharacterized DUF497 family protein